MRQFAQIALGVSLLSSGCKPETRVEYVEVYVDREKIVEIAKDSPPDLGGVTNSIAVTGSLNIGGSVGGGLGLASFGLTAAPYSLTCVTFTETPKSFAIAVSQGSGGYVFEGTLVDTAGESFGCFLLNDGDVLAPLLFGDQGSSLLTGAGELKFDVTYNAETKSADATLDKSSPALAADAVSKAKRAKEVVETNLEKLDATYRLSCAVEAGMECTTEDLPSQEVYFRHFKAGDKDKVSLWESKAARDRCTSGALASDAKPSFNMKIGSLDIAMDFSSPEQLRHSLDSAFATLESSEENSMQNELAEMIATSARQNVSWRAEQCENNPYSQASCRLVLGETETNTWTDYYTKKTHSYTYPIWYNQEDFDGLTDYAGVVETRSLPCKTYWTEDGEICPLATEVNDDGEGSYNAFFGTSPESKQKRLRLICSNGNDVQHQDWAQAGSKADAISAAKTTAGCDLVTDESSPFTGSITAYRDEVRNKLSEIAAFGLYHKPEEICRNNQLPPSFKFNDCSSSLVMRDIGQLRYVYWEKEMPSWVDENMVNEAANEGYEYISYFSKDWSVAEFCRDINEWLLPSWGFEIDADTNKLVDSNESSGQIETSGQIDPYQAREVCPDHAGGLSDLFQELNNQDCRSEFFAADAREQIKRIQKVRIGQWSPLQYLACPDVSNRASIVEGLKTQCLPQAFSNWVCDNSGNCRQNLQCAGTKGGKCYDKLGTFIGSVSGRLAVMDAKAGVNNAFSLTSTVKDEWMAYDMEKQQMKACKMTNDSVMNTKLSADSASGVAYLKQKFRQECREAKDSDITPTAGLPGNQNGEDNENFTREIPETDTLSKIKLTLCENHSCD